MFEIIKNVIDSRDYELVDMLYKINKMYIESNITDKQKQELDNLARQNAKAENSYASVQEQIDKAFREIESNAVGMSALKDAVEKLGGKIEGPTKPEPEKEYPEYVQPQGAHDAYKIGDKITYNNKKYICKLDNCVWSPETYPQAWQEVEG